MGILSWIVLGGIAGWIASVISGTNDNQGLVGNIFVGMIGAVIGGFIGTKLFNLNVTGLNFSSLALSVLGGLIFIFVWGLFTGKKSL